LADAGGSHGYRPHLGKAQGQSHLSAALRLSVTVGHDPTGCSQWHPIAPRLFSQIRIHWAGKPWRPWETMLGLSRGTTSQTRLTVSAHVLAGIFETGNKVSDTVRKTLHMTRHALCPQWNSTMQPRLGTPPAPCAAAPKRETIFLQALSELTFPF
jgi:hypothetical protein